MRAVGCTASQRYAQLYEHDTAAPAGARAPGRAQASRLAAAQCAATLAALARSATESVTSKPSASRGMSRFSCRRSARKRECQCRLQTVTAPHRAARRGILPREDKAKLATCSDMRDGSRRWQWQWQWQGGTTIRWCRLIDHA